MALSPFRVSPHLISLATFVVGMTAAWSLSASRALVGGLLTQAASMLDGMDGETARLHHRTTPFGAWLDDLMDRMVDAAVVAGLCLWMWDEPGRTFRAIVLVVAAVGLAVVHFNVGKKVTRFDVADSAGARPLGVLLGGRDVRLLVLAAGSVAGQPALAIAATALLYVGGIARRAVLLRPGSTGTLAPAAVAAPRQVRGGADRDLQEVG
jgi:phosphatidylglycerophosphate synthase